MFKRFTGSILLCLIVLQGAFYVPVAQAASLADFKVPRGFRFEKDLYRGMPVDSDLFYLQNLLNMSTSTRVALTGNGSNERLTSNYADKTQSAVGRFQNVFDEDINFEYRNSTSTEKNNYIRRASKADLFTRGVLNKLVIIYADAQIQVQNGTTTKLFSTSTTAQNNVLEYRNEMASFIYPKGGLVSEIIEGTSGNRALSSDGSSNAGLIIGAAAVVAGVVAAVAASNVSKGVFNIGGPIVTIIPCICSLNFLLYITDVRTKTPTPLMYQPGVTLLYRMYTPMVGVNTLGQYIPGGTCSILYGTTCGNGPTPNGTLMQLGTGL